MNLFTKTALAGGVLALTIAGGLGLHAAAEANERGSYANEKQIRFAHADGERRYGGRGHRGGRHHGRRGKGRRGRRMKRVRHMMNQYDTNDDRKLTIEEVRSGRQAQIERFDRNTDGGIDLQEFAPLWAEMRKQRIIRRFQRIDRNGDGKITSEEFVNPAVRMVERMDRNGDGALSREDRRRWREGGRGRGRGFWRRMRGGEDNVQPERESEAPQKQQ